MARILIVDDEADVRRSLRTMLQTEHEIVEAEDGKSAIAVVEKEHVDIAFAGVRASETLGAIQRASADPWFPILVIAPTCDESSIARWLNAGAADVLFAPLSPTLIKAKIGTLLRARDLMEATQRQTRELSGYRGHVEAENKIARKVFESITRGEGALLPGVDTRSFAMDTFSGDLVLLHPMENGRLRMMLGDFSGHGLSAAIGAIPATDVFYAMCRRDLPLARIAVELNAKIHRSMPRNIFLSACLAELDMETRELSVFNAGVPDVLIVSKRGQIAKRVRSNNVPLGILPAEKFDVTLQRVEIEDDDRILFCSDGALETLNPHNQFLGEEGFNRLVERAHEAAWLESIVRQLDQFRQDAKRADDVTLMAIQCGAPLRHALLADKELERTELSVDVRYGADALRDEVALEPFVHALEGFSALTRHSGELYAVISELYSNALEHGILRLDSEEKADAAGFLRYYQTRKQMLSRLQAGEIRMSLRVASRGGHRIARVRVEDSGPGVRPEKRAPRSLGEAAFAGRGLAMVRSLCERLTFADGGAVVEADYLLDRDPAPAPRPVKSESPDPRPTGRPSDSLHA
ncbi:MAG: fused response regulator/phosphatase [Polyangiaceae bacterium]